MNKLHLIALVGFILITKNSFCQNKNSFIVNAGFNVSDFYSKFFYWQYCDEQCQTINQSSKTFLDLNFIYERRITNRIYIPIGIGGNTKGFDENGIEMTGNGVSYIPYYDSFTMAYLGFYLGLSYDIYSKNNFKINIGELLNPQIAMSSSENSLYKNYPISCRTNLSIRHFVTDTKAILITVFFETALSNYNDERLFPSSKDWKPYGYGINAGFLW